jgi:hypothetical protein
MQNPPPAQLADAVALVILSIALITGLASMLFGWVVRQWDHFVNRSQISDTDIMSRSQDEAPQKTLSSHRQTAPQTDRQPAQPAPSPLSRDIMLDIYRLLREHNVPREKARPVLKAAGIPLDNNLWTQAASSTDDAEDVLTPIAGRPTKASYYPDDLDLEYQSPPR